MNNLVKASLTLLILVNTAWNIWEMKLWLRFSPTPTPVSPTPVPAVQVSSSLSSSTRANNNNLLEGSSYACLVNANRLLAEGPTDHDHERGVPVFSFVALAPDYMAEGAVMANKKQNKNNYYYWITFNTKDVKESVSDWAVGVHGFVTTIAPARTVHKAT